MTNINEQDNITGTADLAPAGGAFAAPEAPDAQGSSHPDPKKVASAAASETSAVAHKAVEAGKDLKNEAAAQASTVAGQAKDQISTVVTQAKSELKAQADTRSEQAAAGLQTLADQLGALAEGRPGEAGHVGALVSDAQQRVHAYSQTLQTRGPQAVIEDLTSFARRRPLVFLLGAAVAGFAAGRLVRATAAVKSDDSDAASAGGFDTQAYGTQEFAAPAALPAPEASEIMYSSELS